VIRRGELTYHPKENPFRPELTPKERKRLNSDAL
jgi:hypothetical protein